MMREKRILVIEDDKAINHLIAYNLRKNGFSPESVYDGSEAQKMLSREKFDVAIVDIMLPGVDGFHICKRIKEDPSLFRTFVVMLTARCEPQDKVYGHLVGTDCYLTKPFSVSRLMEIIKEFINMRDKTCALA